MGSFESQRRRNFSFIRLVIFLRSSEEVFTVGPLGVPFRLVPGAVIFSQARISFLHTVCYACLDVAGGPVERAGRSTLVNRQLLLLAET